MRETLGFGKVLQILTWGVDTWSVCTYKIDVTLSNFMAGTYHLDKKEVKRIFRFLLLVGMFLGMLSGSCFYPVNSLIVSVSLVQEFSYFSYHNFYLLHITCVENMVSPRNDTAIIEQDTYPWPRDFLFEENRTEALQDSSFVKLLGLSLPIASHKTDPHTTRKATIVLKKSRIYLFSSDVAWYKSQEIETAVEVHYEDDKWVCRNANIVLACLPRSYVTKLDSVRSSLPHLYNTGMLKIRDGEQFQCKSQPSRAVGKTGRPHLALWEIVMWFFTEVLRGHRVRDDPSVGTCGPFLVQEIPRLPSILFFHDCLLSMGPVWDPDI